MCYKQAGLMQDLRARLIYGGFPEVEFRILNPESTASEASDGLWRLRFAAGHPTIPVLQETPSNSLWQSLVDGAMDHILVLDRCRRLTYQVITPWSILHFPYVKAAILSTYEDNPCGRPCSEILEQETSSSTTGDLSITNDNPAVDVNENARAAADNSAEEVEMPSSLEAPPSAEQTTDIAENLVIDDTHEMKGTLAPLVERTDGTVPIRVVMHAPHRHRHVNGTLTQHEYLELQTGNPDYHGHLANDNNIVVEQTIKRKKYKGQKRKDKLKSEAIQAETQENNNYEDMKLKHHRHKERPGENNQQTNSGEQNVSEEEEEEEAAAAAAAATAATTAAATTPFQDETTPFQDNVLFQDGTTLFQDGTIPFQDGAIPFQDGAIPFQERTTPEAVEVNTEVGTQEIPQEIQEHYDYSNMPYYQQSHKAAVRVTEGTTAALQESAVSPDKDHSTWESHTQVMVNTNNSTATPTSNQHSANTLEDNTDHNFPDTEEHRNYEEGKEMDNQPTNNELSDEDDEENKKQVIEHYSQLLKWIHYSLPETVD